MSTSPYRSVLEGYMERKKVSGEPLPGIRGRVNYKGVAIETGIPARQFRKDCELRLLLDVATTELTVSKRGLYEQPHHFLEVEGRSPSMTYDDLKTGGVAWLQQEGYTKTTVMSYVSHLNVYRRHLGRTGDCSTVKDFGVYFERQSQAFLRTKDKNNAAAASALRLWAQIHYELHQATASPASFAAALAERVVNSGRQRRDIARAAGIDDPDAVGDWMRGDRKPTDPDQVARVEKVLGLPPGTLSSKLNFSSFHRRSVIPKAWWPELWRKSYASYRHQRDKVLALIPEPLLTGSLGDLRPAFDKALQAVLDGEGELIFRQKVRTFKPRAYRLHFRNWSERLQAEFSALTAYKTAPNSLGNRGRRGKWKESTVISARGQLEAFFGFLLLPVESSDPQFKGMGLEREDLTLAWLAVQEVVIDFLDFRFIRSGAHSGGTETFINKFGAFLQPESGWLWLHPELFERLPEQEREVVEAAGGWRDHCVQVRLELRDALASLKHNGEIKKTRDPMLAIWPILDHPRPLSLIGHALNLHRADLEARGRLDKLFSRNLAVAWRDHLLISLLARFPLRAKHWGLLTYKMDGTGYLQKHSRDGWQLVIPYDDFKNVRNETVFPPNNPTRTMTLKFCQAACLKAAHPAAGVLSRARLAHPRRRRAVPLPNEDRKGDDDS